MNLGYTVAGGPEVAPDSHRNRNGASYGDVILVDRLKLAIARLNPALPEDARADAFRRVLQVESPSLVAENRRLHKAMVEGVDVEYFGADGVIRGEQVRLIDFDDVEANDWLAVNQFTVNENKANRRADVVVFVNGLPLAEIELKNPGDENATLDGAFNQLLTYQSQIPSLFRTNATLVISDGIAARIGSLTADRERFMPWRTIDGSAEAGRAQPELETVIKGVFDKRRLLDLVKDFIVFGDTGSDVSKILAGYHQFRAVHGAVDLARLRRRARMATVAWALSGIPKVQGKAF